MRKWLFLREVAMQVFDDWIDHDRLLNLRSWILGQSLIHGWRAHKNAPGTFWHRNFVLPGSHQHHYDPGAWHPHLTLDQLLKTSTPLTDIANLIQNQFFGKSEITRVWVNVQSFGDESAFHRDFPVEFMGTARSVILYVVDQWKNDWGGDLVVLDEAGEIESAAMVKPGRVVSLNGCKRHAVRPISRYCNALRIALVFGAEVSR
jgi:Rps23 Pro-64 3,4-dihydroxylase Tpa1-like proline 4-hydroxylase